MPTAITSDVTKLFIFFFLLQVSELQIFQYRMHTKCKQRFNSYFAWVSELKFIFHVTLYYRGIDFSRPEFFFNHFAICNLFVNLCLKRKLKICFGGRIAS